MNACELWWCILVGSVNGKHESEHGQNSCVGCDCAIYGEDSNEEEESEVVEVAPNTEPVVEVAPVADVIPSDVEHVNLIIEPSYEETFKQTLRMLCTEY